jgi:hypothetical protein
MNKAVTWSAPLLVMKCANGTQNRRADKMIAMQNFSFEYDNDTELAK